MLDDFTTSDEYLLSIAIGTSLFRHFDQHNYKIISFGYFRDFYNCVDYLCHQLETTLIAIETEHPHLQFDTADFSIFQLLARLDDFQNHYRYYHFVLDDRDTADDFRKNISRLKQMMDE